MEALERNYAGMMRNNTNVSKQDVLTLQNELKVDKYGTRADRVEIGPSGKQLNLDGFKFDQNFGAKYHQDQPQYNQNSANEFGFSYPGVTSSNTQPEQFAAPIQKEDFYGKSQTTQSSQPTKPKVGEKGFLDFDNIFGGGGASSQGGKSYNPFN